MVLHYYKTSLSAALIDLFPNIGLDKSKFQVSSSMHSVKKKKLRGEGENERKG